MMGHGSPETTLEHYIHFMDYIARFSIEKFLLPPVDMLSNALNKSSSTIYRWVKEGPDEYRDNLYKQHQEYLERPLALTFSEVIPNFSLQIAEHEVVRKFDESWKILFKLVQKPVMSRFEESDRYETLSAQYGVSSLDIEKWSANLRELLGVKENNLNNVQRISKRINLETYEGKVLPLPARPREVVKDKIAYYEVVDALSVLFENNPEEFQRLLEAFEKNTQKRNYLLKFTNLETARLVTSALTSIESENIKINYTLLHGKKQSDSNVKRVCIPHWRMGLKLSKKLVFHTSLANSDAKAGEFGWLGVNLVNAKTGKSIEGLRYAFAMMYILEKD
jgi:hypothetical protein